MNFKPFYIKYEGIMTTAQVAEVFDKAVKAGATPYEAVEGYDSRYLSGSHYPWAWEYFGVNGEGETVFQDYKNDYGEDAVELTLDQVDEHLGIKSVASDNCVSSLRNVKIDLRKEDGSVDEEKSAAFQKAVFETGGGWSDYTTSVIRSHCFYLYVDDKGKLAWDEDDGEYFKNHSSTEIDFQYETITTWTATEKVNKETIEIGGDAYFKEDVVKALSSLKKVGG